MKIVETTVQFWVNFSMRWALKKDMTNAVKALVNPNNMGGSLMELSFVALAHELADPVIENLTFNVSLPDLSPL